MSNKPILTLAEFVTHMSELKVLEGDLDNADKAMRVLSPDFGGFYLTRPIEMILSLLEDAMGGDKEEADWIGYFIYELDWGAKWKTGMITEKDGTDIKLATLEYLYNRLEQETIP